MAAFPPRISPRTEVTIINRGRGKEQESNALLANRRKPTVACRLAPLREKFDSFFRTERAGERTSRHTYVGDVFYAKFSGVTATTSIISKFLVSKVEERRMRIARRVETLGGRKRPPEYTVEDSGRESGEVEG